MPCPSKPPCKVVPCRFTAARLTDRGGLTHAFEFSGKPKPQLCRNSVVLCRLFRVHGRRSTEMDALSEALASVRMTGAIFYHAECTAPWGFRVPPLETVAHILAPGTERLVTYHLVTEGKAVAEFADTTISLTAGDVLIIPQGDPHTVSNGAPSEFIDSGVQLGRVLSGERTTM